MSNINNNGKIEISKALIGCLGAVLAAIIGGVFLLISTGVIQIGVSTSAMESLPQEPVATPVISEQSSINEASPNLNATPTTSSDNIEEPKLPQVKVTYPQIFSTREHFPDSTSTTITVKNGEIHAMTSGPICVSDTCLQGGTDRGSVVIFLPAANYEVTGLNPTWNWHGAYYATSDQWKAIADQLVEQQKIPGTCADGDGCSIVDVLVVSPNGVQELYQD